MIRPADRQFRGKHDGRLRFRLHTLGRYSDCRGFFRKAGPEKQIMANVTVSIPHQLTRAEAKRRIQEGVSKMRQQGGSPLSSLKETWTGDTLDFSGYALGQNFTGRLFVEDQAVRIEVALPAFFSMLADVLKPTIEQRGRQLLAGPKPP